MLFFMDHRARGLVRRNNRLAKELKALQARPVQLGLQTSRAIGLGRRVVKERGLGKVWTSRVRKNLAGTPNGYWVFMDRRDKASDNAEALYRYVRDNKIHDKIAYVIRRDVPDYDRLVADGFNVVEYNTVAQWKLLYNCEHFFASHVDDVIITPWTEFGADAGKPRYKLNFLQHGIIRSDLSSWLGAKSYHTFCSSAQREYDGLINNVRYNLTPESLKLTGLARHDRLEARDGDYILVSPTWRSFLAGAEEEDFRASEFFRSWHKLIYDPRLSAALAKAGVHLKVVLHSSISEFASCFEETDLIKVSRYEDVVSFADLLSDARLLVTDYSSISFDVLYLRRPVVYFTFPETQRHSTNSGADLDLYGELGYRAETVDGAVEAIAAAAGRAFAADPEKVARADAFFAFGNDGQNCKRIIEAVLERDNSR
jgi:CDP-glycerol glycerophosphotransferase (TagB/SpsB family)